MRSNATIGTKLLGGTAALFVLAAILGYSGLSNARSFKDRYNDTVDRTVRKVVLSDKIGSAASEIYSAQRGTVLAAFSKDHASLENDRQTFQQQNEIIQRALDEMRPLIDKEEARALVADIAESLSQWRPQFEELARQASTGRLEEANQIRLGTKSIANKIAAASSRLQAIQAEILAEDKAAVNSQSASSQRIALGLLVLCAIVGLIVIIVVRGVTRDVGQAATHLAEGAAQVASAATQVSAASQSLAQGSSEQAASLEETSSSSEEINSMTHKNAENSRAAAELTSQVDQRVGVANQKLEQMVASMTEINTSSEKVSKIIKVIDEIAFQTNILALNAAVEAARAGEAGMGFAVVADEVRNLAQRCAQAAKDTASLIEESLGKSHEGMSNLDHVAEAIRSITESSAKMKVLVDEVNLGSQEQERGIEQIAKAIVQMEQVTQKNAANAEESASASEELSGQAETMRAVVGQLQALVSGQGKKPGRPAPGGYHARPKPAAATKSGDHSRGLKALQSAVSGNKVVPAAKAEPVWAGKLDRNELPLDDDFKEF
jgi:methyl-accepting chemotaxis protein/methyl-accepting chemotaxis protein-1 (serine sensor receptor)